MVGVAAGHHEPRIPEVVTLARIGIAIANGFEIKTPSRYGSRVCGTDVMNQSIIFSDLFLESELDLIIFSIC